MVNEEANFGRVDARPRPELQNAAGRSWHMGSLAMLVYLTLLEDCLIVSVRPRGAGIVGDAAHELQVIGPADKFHEIEYERLRQLGEGQHEIDAA